MDKQPHIKKREPHELPSALLDVPGLLGSRRPAVFLDYDGCLSPIVNDPAKAVLTDGMRATLQRLAALCTVAVVSGRDRADVEQLVHLGELYYAGSHGFDITGPDNMKTEPAGAKAAFPALDKAQEALTAKLGHVSGAFVERKKYAIAVHFRNVADDQVAFVQQETLAEVARHPELKKGLGKKIIELKPAMDWHKGKAVLWLLTELNLDQPDVLPLYIGDDITDEDAFAALQGRGIGILVGTHDEKTAATYSLKDVEDVQAFLEALTQTIKAQQ